MPTDWKIGDCAIIVPRYRGGAEIILYMVVGVFPGATFRSTGCYADGQAGRVYCKPDHAVLVISQYDTPSRMVGYYCEHMWEKLEGNFHPAECNHITYPACECFYNMIARASVG